MTDCKEQRICFKFCFDLEQTASETYEMLDNAVVMMMMMMSTVPTSAGYSCLESGQTWVEDFKHTHCHLSSQTDETAEKLLVIREDKQWTVNVCNTIDLLHVSH